MSDQPPSGFRHGPSTLPAGEHLPWWGSISTAVERTGVSSRLIEEWEKDGLIRAANVRRPGASRGRKLYDMWSLFDFIEGQVGASPAELAMNSKKLSTTEG